MSGEILDYDSGAPNPPKGKNGAQLVIMSDKTGTPAGGASSQVYPMHATTSTATLTGTLTPPVTGLRLRKLVLSVSENVTLAAAGVVQISVSLNGTQIFSEGFFAPASPSVNAGMAHHRDIPFDNVDLEAGSGSLTWTLSTAFTAGQLDINAYFGN